MTSGKSLYYNKTITLGTSKFVVLLLKFAGEKRSETFNMNGQKYHIKLKKYPDVLDINQMCEILGVSVKTGYSLLQSNKIACLKVGRAYRIPKAHILTYLLIGTHPVG